MLISNIHAYFHSIDLNPALGWDMLETDLDDICSEVRNTRQLRALLAKYASMYLDMAMDDEDARDGQLSTFYTTYVVPLLTSRLPMTMDEQRIVLGSAAWFGNDRYISCVRAMLFDRVHVVPTLAPADAVVP